MHKIMFLGQKPIGERCLKIISNSCGENLQIAAIVSNKDGNSVWWKNNEGYQYAARHNIPFIDNSKRNADEIKACIKENDINFLISVQHGWIIDKETLSMVNGNAVNLHLAQLPEYQGNFSFNHAILNGDKKYGITLHYMKEEVDTGDYVMMPTFDITEKDTAYSLYNKSMDLAEEAFKDFIKMLSSGEELPRNKMSGTPRFYARNSIDGLRMISDISDKKEVRAKAHAFYFPPFERAYAVIDGSKYYVEPEVCNG